MGIDMKKFIRERDEALLSLDEARIKTYCKKYGVPIPENEEVFWRGVHKAICHINSATAAQKEYSAIWLYTHNSRPEVQ